MLNRKEFLEKMGLALAGVVVAPSVLSSCTDKGNNNPTPKGDVIVIGAGMAGLGCAKKLKDSGYTVTVLEGRNRVGGRIFTDRSLNGVPADMGASWIHGPDGNNPITPLAQQANATTYLTDNNSLLVYDVNGAVIPDNVIDPAYNNYKALLQNVKNNSNPSKSIRDVLQQISPNSLNDLTMQYQFSAYAEFDAGGDIANMSSAYFDNDERFPGKDVLFPNGYDAIPRKLAEGLDIKLNQKVTKIDYSNPSQVTVTTNQGTFTAKYVVITLPLGVLKSGNVSFTPALPTNKQNAIGRLQMGNVNKVLAVFNNAFWDTNLQYFGYTSQIKGQYNYFLNVKKFYNANALMTFGFGNYGVTMETQTDAQVQSDMMNNLKKIFGNSIPNPTNLLVSRWGSDPFAYGAYSFANVNTDSTEFDTISQAIDNRLFFAGEHTHATYRGTVHGAYLSGTREADKIISL